MKKKRVDAALVPPHTAFDYLEGAFKRAERARYTGLGLVSLALIMLVGVFVTGLIALADVSTAEQKHVRASQMQKELAAEVAALDTVGGFPTTVLDSHISSRTQTLSSLLHNELDVVQIISQLHTSTPSGLDITGITFGPNSEGEDSEAPTGQAKLMVAAVTTSFDLIPRWLENVESIEALTNAEVEWTGGSTVEVTLDADFTADAYTQRFQDLSPSTDVEAHDGEN